MYIKKINGVIRSKKKIRSKIMFYKCRKTSKLYLYHLDYIRFPTEKISRYIQQFMIWTIYLIFEVFLRFHRTKLLPFLHWNSSAKQELTTFLTINLKVKTLQYNKTGILLVTSLAMPVCADESLVPSNRRNCVGF